MSKKICALYHPTSKESSDVYRGFNWPCLFFGPLWFAVKGMWLWVIVSLLLGCFTFGFSGLIFPFLANGMYKKHLRANGWLTEEQTREVSMTQQQFVQPPPQLTTPLTQPLASVGFQPPNASPVVPSGDQSNTPTMPSDALEVAPPPQPTAVGSFRSKSFILAKVEQGISWKNEYDVLDADAGAVFLEQREGEVLGLSKFARMMKTTASLTGFDVMFKTQDGQPCFRFKNRGAKGGGDVFNGADAQIGAIKLPSMRSWDLLGIDARGAIRFTTKSKRGLLKRSHEILNADTVIGMITEIDKDGARKILGASFDRLNNARNYDYAYHVNLSVDLEDLEKALLFGAVYSIAHMSARF